MLSTINGIDKDSSSQDSVIGKVNKREREDKEDTEGFLILFRGSIIIINAKSTFNVFGLTGDNVIPK